MIKFASFCPHPPLLLPSIGSDEDRLKVEKTRAALEKLRNKFKKAGADTIIISSPHPDWGFDVPLSFLAPGWKKEIKKYLIGAEPPAFYFEKGKKIYSLMAKNKKYALIGSGDMSHVLKKDGPYGFNADGPKYDKAFIKYLEEKDIKNFLKLDEIFPSAGECGLRPFSFILGILYAWQADSTKLRMRSWQSEILSYESPFGVGYLTVNFKL